jgi:hypothetical protein
MLIGAKTMLGQLAEESQVAPAHQACTGLCGFFYLGHHPKYLSAEAGRGLANHRLIIVRNRFFAAPHPVRRLRMR